MADNFPQPPMNDTPIKPVGDTQREGSSDPSKNAPWGYFPPSNEKQRLSNYEYFSRLFHGNHYTAFKLLIQDDEFNKAYSKIRYITANFAGLITKVVADMLFSEPATAKVPDGDQDFVDALWRENNLDIQNYESALSNSYLGDALFKLRVGPREPNDTDSTVIIEDITPTIYFPKIDGFNVRSEPEVKELCWTFKVGDKEYLRKEIHTAGLITNEVYLLEGEKVTAKVDLGILGENAPAEMVLTEIDKSLLVHVPNWKTGNRYYGISDYHDLDSLFFAINNRMSKTDNILDKHSDPILAVPPGVLNEKGEVRKKAFGVIEIGEGEDGRPEYIVWNASLENAFKEVEKLVEFIYMVGEVSPDILGLGKDVSASGRALKFKLIRTIAKVARKKLYYNRALREVIYAAQLLAKAHGLKVGGKTLQGEPMRPEIEWADGLPIDIGEQLENEQMALDAGVTSKRDVIMRVYGVDEKAADQMMKDIEKEKPKIELPGMNMGGKNPFEQNKGNQPISR